MGGPAGVAPADPGEGEYQQQDNFNEGDAGGPAAAVPHIAGSNACDGSPDVVGGEVEACGGGASSGGSGHAQKAGRGGLRDEDASADQAEAGDYHDPEMVAEGEGFAGEADCDGDSDAAAHADAGNEVSAKRRDDEADEIDGEEIAKGEGGKAEGRIGEIEGAVGEGCDQGEEGSEADAESGEQTGIAEVAESDPEAGFGLGRVMRGRARSLRREPAGDEESAEEGEGAKENEAPAPAERVGDEAGEEATEESAQRSGADVEAHHERNGFATPFFADVGDDGGEDAGEREALHESPEDEGVKAGRGGSESGGSGENEDGPENDALAAELLGEGAEDGGGERHAEGGGADSEANRSFRSMEKGGEQGQHGLRGIKVKEGEDAAEADGDYGAEGVEAHMVLGERLDDRDGRIGRRQLRSRGRVHSTE